MSARLGQHFLVDGSVVGAIVSLVAPKAGDVFVEVGPGRGALTLPILAAGPSVHAVEMDGRLAGALPKLAGSNAARLSVTEGDAARSLPVPVGVRWRLAGNIPYSISSPLLAGICPRPEGIVDAHLMLQREFADRVAAPPGSRDYGRISVLVQSCYRVETLLEVGPESFDPPPKVDSAVIRLTPSDDAGSVADRGVFDGLLRAAFAKRRKKLSNAIGGRFALPDDRFAGLRAEQLSAADYVELANAISARGLQ